MRFNKTTIQTVFIFLFTLGFYLLLSGFVFETWLLFLSGVFLSALVSFTVKRYYEMSKRLKEQHHEITGLKEKAAAIYYDALTGIYNRRYFDEKFALLIKTLSRAGGHLSLLMIDVDFFKHYNDTYGHGAGDQCLKIIAGILAKGITRTADFAARYGGEEFVVVLPYTDKKGALLIANKFLRKIKDENITHEASAVTDYVTVSIGVTTGRAAHAQSAEEYLRQADKALYNSKRKGRNKCSFRGMAD